MSLIFPRNNDDNDRSIKVQKGSCVWSGGVVVITSASHAEGREFDPRPDLQVFSCK